MSGHSTLENKLSPTGVVFVQTSLNIIKEENSVSLK